jgi:hypothetical protein
VHWFACAETGRCRTRREWGHFTRGKSTPPAHRTGLFRPTDNRKAAKKLLLKDGKEWSQLDEAIPEELYLAQCSQVDVAVSLVDETGKSFKESRQKNWAGGAIEEHLGRRLLGEKVRVTTSFIDTSYCCGHFVGTKITQIFPGFLVATWELKCGHFLGTKITQIFQGVFW